MKKILLIIMVLSVFMGFSEENYTYIYTFKMNDIDNQYGNSSLIISSDTTNTHFINYIKLQFKDKTIDLESHNSVVDKDYNKILFIDKNIYGIRKITILVESVILEINNDKFILTNSNPSSTEYRTSSFGERNSKNINDTTIFIGINEPQEEYMKRVYELAKSYKRVIYIKETEKEWVLYLRKEN